MGHKAQLPSGEAVCCCCALCILSYIPVVASVCGHSCSSAELLYKVFRGCCCVVFFFFLLDFSTFLLCEGTIWHSYYIRTCRQFPLRQYTRAGLHVKEENEGGRWAKLLPRTKSQNIQGLYHEIGNSPPSPTPVSPVIICHSLLSLYGVRCWCGHLPSVPHQSQLGRRITACWALRATALAREQLGSLLWL